MVALIEPHIRGTVDEGEILDAHVGGAVDVVVLDFRAGRDTRVSAGGERLVAPGLVVIHRQNAGYERGPRARRGLIRGDFRASGVEVGAGVCVCGVCVESGVLGAEAAVVCAVDAAGSAEGEDDALDVGGVVAEAGPGFAVGVGGESCVDGEVGGGRVGVCDV